MASIASLLNPASPTSLTPEHILLDLLEDKRCQAVIDAHEILDDLHPISYLGSTIPIIDKC